MLSLLPAFTFASNSGGVLVCPSQEPGCLHTLSTLFFQEPLVMAIPLKLEIEKDIRK